MHAAMTAANGNQSFKGIGSDTILTVPQATDQVAVNWVADMSVGTSTTSLSTTLTDTMDPMVVLSHGHTMPAAAVSGRFCDADMHTSTEQWQAKTDTLALSFWNHTTTAFSNQSMSSNTAITLTSFNMATTPMEPPRDTHSGTTLRQGQPPDTARQPVFWYCIDLAFSYLWSDKFQSARPPDNKQSPKPSSRPPDDKGSHELCGCSLKIPEGHPYSASTRTAQTQDTDS